MRVLFLKTVDLACVPFIGHGARSRACVISVVCNVPQKGAEAGPFMSDFDRTNGFVPLRSSDITCFTISFAPALRLLPLV